MIYDNKFDDFGDEVKDIIYDAPTRQGPWAWMTEKSWRANARSFSLGVGRGQKYVRKDGNLFEKVEG